MEYFILRGIPQLIRPEMEQVQPIRLRDAWLQFELDAMAVCMRYKEVRCPTKNPHR